MKWLGYAWRVIANIVYVLVFAAVLSRFSDRFEVTMVAIGGLVLTGIGALTLLVNQQWLNLSFPLAEELSDLRRLISRETFDNEGFEAAKTALTEQKNRLQIHMLINSLGFGAASLLCIWRILTAY